MRLSNLLMPTRKEDPAEAEIASHKLLIRGGYVRMVARGIYDFLPLGWRSLKKIEEIIREEMNDAGAQEVLLPGVQPAELWKESGRWEEYGPELLRFQDRKGGDFCLGPTHEEVITAMVRGEVNSYKQLPMNIYQIQTKFRDEPRPRFGILRAREFIMKDAYSFDVDEEAAAKSYEEMFDTYGRICDRLGFEWRAVEADTGAIGGSRSHEFQVITDTGEDDLVHCPACGYAANIEIVGNDSCPECDEPLETSQGIEIGHIFYLGTKYSEALGATVQHEEGGESPMVMGCYGIGVTRILAAVAEQNHDEEGLIWPMPIAPFEVTVLPLQMGSDEVVETAERLYEDLKAAGVDVLIDDRDEGVGAKFKDADLIGIPLRIAVGTRGLEEGNLEFKLRWEDDIDYVDVDEAAEMAIRMVPSGQAPRPPRP